METKVKPTARNFNKYAYAASLLAAFLFFLKRDYSQASIFMGLALVFDPFDTAVSFGKRPLWQRVWLIVHLLVTLSAFILLAISNK